MKTKILTRHLEILKFVETIQQRADSSRDALGFLPSSAYTQAAAQEKIIVAVVPEGDNDNYAGHLMFGGAFPNGRIFQIYVEPAFRQQGIGEDLIDAVVHRYETEQFLSLKASVASDLESANDFWQRMGFQIALVKPGGVTRGRTINVRIRDLKVPSLLSLFSELQPDVRDDLGLVDNLTNRSPLYVIDLNVLFDITKRRPRSEQAGRVIAAACKNTIRLAISEEFVQELKRNSIDEPKDPILLFVLTLWKLALPTEEQLRKYENLGKILFPSRFQNNCLTVQDISDIRHLATAIHHNAAGFVTSENAILRARAEIQSKFGVDIVGLEEFTFAEEPEPVVDFETIAVAKQGTHIDVHDFRTNETDQVINFLKEFCTPQDIIFESLQNTPIDGPLRQVVITADHDIVAFGSWKRTLGPKRNTKIFIRVDETHPLCETAIDFLLNRACIELSGSAPSLLSIDDLPGRTTTRRLAIAQGFRLSETESSGRRILQKLSVGRPITPSNWSTMSEQIWKVSGVTLPKDIPGLTTPSEKISIRIKSGKIISVTLHDLENLLSPALFLSQSRYGAIVPIQRLHADELLGTSDQQSFLESKEASLLNERAYFCTTRAANALKPGTPLLFYESGGGRGRSSIIAVGRSVKSDIVLKSEFPVADSRRGVIDEEMLDTITTSDHVLATRFDNVMPLPNLISFKQLKTMGAIDGSNLVSSRLIDGQTFLDIITRGWSIE